MHGGDLTRSTFDPSQHFSGVRLQQGRVALDADWNEQVDIATHRDRADIVDTIGDTGAPKDGGGFALVASPDGSDLLLSPGRMWVNGTLCEIPAEDVAATVTGATVTVGALVLDGRSLAVHDWVEIRTGNDDRWVSRLSAVDVAAGALTLTTAPPATLAEPLRLRRVASYATQDDLPEPPHTTQPDPATPRRLDIADGTFLAYLDVWQRSVTALEAPVIREQALGGPDTATRTRTTSQVRLLELDGAPADLNCASDLSSWTHDAWAAPTGRMAARAEQVDPDTINLCTPTPAGGFRGLENQLYRVQVHDVTEDGAPVILWSRENGSITTSWTGSAGNELTVGDVGKDAVLGFAGGQWIELLDEGRVLAGSPGTLVPILAAEGTTITVDATNATGTVDHDDFGRGVAFVRRWDSPGPVVASLGDWFDLEDGVRVRFDAGTFRPGDHWLIAARTASADVEWPGDASGRPLARPPLGVEHAVAPLALVRIGGGAVTVLDCRRQFPSLTTLTAGDVTFVNDTCALPGADTVQDALDRLCQARDLRRHHRLLHGWGIVCGLAVQCGPNGTAERRRVTVHPGTAIDVDGNELDLTEARPVDVMTKVDELEQGGTDVLNDAGDGEVCLRLVADARGDLDFEVTELEPRDDIETILRGTLLEDFYDDCIKALHDWLREQLTEPENERSPVSPARQRLDTLVNLAAQPMNPKSGANIFISRREDTLLQEFYQGLRERLQSETFCAMFEGARNPPPYPDALAGIDTIFGIGSHTRLRVRPRGREAYTVGPGSNLLKPMGLINRYDLSEGRLAARIDPVAGKELKPGARIDTDSGSGAVTDVAFSPDGRLIYAAIPTRTEDDTMFRVGEIAADTINWRPPVTICGVKLVTLATTPADPEFVYAIGLRKVTTDGRTAWHPKGIYRVNPAAIDPNLEPLPIDFFPVGHLVVTDDGLAVATAVGSDVPVTAYDRIVSFPLPAGDPVRPITLPSSGTDDLALVVVGAEVRAFVVVNQSGAKVVIGRNVRDGSPIGADDAIVQRGSGAVRLLAVGESVAVTLADSYGLLLLDARAGQLVNDYFLPLQVGPIAIGAAQRTGDPIPSFPVNVLNYVSNTISVVQPELLVPEARFDVAALAAYRKAMLEAYADVLGGFLQYLKDCFFDHFVVRCPQPTGEEVIELACISIRAKQVYKVCNFSRRRYVKSFPTVGYWLSAVPILPALRLLFGRLACTVLAPWFASLNVEEGTEDRVAVETLQRLIDWAHSADPLNRARELRSRTSVTTKAVGFALSQMQPPPPTVPTLITTDLVGQAGAKAAELLAGRGVGVRRELFTGARAAGALLDVGNLLRRPATGDEVTLYEDETGAVRQFAVAKGAAGTPSQMPSDLADRLIALEQEVASLREELARAPRPAKKTTPRTPAAKPKEE